MEDRRIVGSGRVRVSQPSYRNVAHLSGGLMWPYSPTVQCSAVGMVPTVHCRSEVLQCSARNRGCNVGKCH